MAEQKGAYMSRHVKDATGKLGRMRKQLLEARKEAKAAKALFAEADRRNMLLQTENAKLDKEVKELRQAIDLSVNQLAAIKRGDLDDFLTEYEDSVTSLVPYQKSSNPRAAAEATVKLLEDEDDEEEGEDI